MGFTLGLFFENTYNATLDNITALSDTKYFISGDDFRVPQDYNQVVGVYAVGATLTRARLSSPSLLKKAPYEIMPIDATAEPVTRPPFVDLSKNPLQLTTAEALNALTTNTATGGDDQTVMVWMANEKIIPITNQEIFTVKATGTTTAVADTWTNGALTLDSDLDPGTYALVGAKAFGATMIACRFIFTKDDSRPGVIAHDAITDIDEPMFRHGRLGEFGRFEHDTPPRFEIYCAAADTAQTFDLDIMRV